MELDRQSIERRDFPIARRGYDPAAVDAHLRALAAEVDELRWHSAEGRGGASLGAAAAGHVQGIIDAAEASAADIERQAADDARRTRDDAARDAERTRTEMAQRTQAHVEAVSRAAGVLLARVESMDGEVGALVHSLRAGAERLAADLGSVEANVSELYDAVSAPAPVPPAAAPVHPAAAYQPAPQPAPEWVEPTMEPGAAPVVERAVEPTAEPAIELERVSAPEPVVEVEPARIADPAPVVERAVEPERVTEPVTESIPLAGSPPPTFASAAPASIAAPAEPMAPIAPRAEPAAAAPAPPPRAVPAPANGDLDGARLVALNMALNGEPREQADRYLAEHFQLADRAQLLDEVYAAIEG